jgi:hydrogenase/urease accessory protein HupE
MNIEHWINFGRLGFHHILDPQGIDHIVFLTVLVAVYRWNNWKSLLWAISAFTLGHTLTLGLASGGLGQEHIALIEFAIPLTIFLTGLYNLSAFGQRPTGKLRIIVAGIFGLIHGLGFGGFFRMLSSGSDSVWLDLIPFTLGIEIGQLLAVVGLLVLSGLFHTAFQMKSRDWTLFVSGLGMGMALLMMLDRWPEAMFF